MQSHVQSCEIGIDHSRARLTKWGLQLPRHGERETIEAMTCLIIALS
jgi:hypothetical protein